MTTNEFMEAVHKALKAEDDLVAEILIARTLEADTLATLIGDQLTFHRGLLLGAIKGFFSLDGVRKDGAIRDINFILNDCL